MCVVFMYQVERMWLCWPILCQALLCKGLSCVMMAACGYRHEIPVMVVIVFGNYQNQESKETNEAFWKKGIHYHTLNPCTETITWWLQSLRSKMLTIWLAVLHREDYFRALLDGFCRTYCRVLSFTTSQSFCILFWHINFFVDLFNLRYCTVFKSCCGVTSCMYSRYEPLTAKDYLVTRAWHNWWTSTGNDPCCVKKQCQFRFADAWLATSGCLWPVPVSITSKYIHV